MKIRSALVILALSGICSMAMAQWQWLDRDGRKVFSDRAPPPDVLDKDILKRPSGQIRAAVAKDSAKSEGASGSEGTASGNLPPPGGLDKELEAKKKQAADAEAAKKKVEEERITKLRIENCARAKQAVSGFDSGQRISRTTASGEREVLDDASRAVERARVQSIVDSECK